MQDPRTSLTAPDGTKLSKLEQRAMLLEAHIQSLSEARRTQVARGKQLHAAEVVALDEQIRMCHERMGELRERDVNPSRPRPTGGREMQIEDDDLLGDLLLPPEELAKVITMRTMLSYSATRYASTPLRTPKLSRTPRTPGSARVAPMPDLGPSYEGPPVASVRLDIGGRGGEGPVQVRIMPIKSEPRAKTKLALEL